MKIYRRFLPYSLAIASTAIALLLTLWLEPLMPRTIGAFFYIAIIFSTWFGGFMPGVVAVVLSTVAINYFFIEPHYQFFLLDKAQDLVQLSFFLVVALTINFFASNLKESKQKIEDCKQAENWQHQQSINQVEDLYNQAPCGYHSLDATGTIVMINDTELNWLGYTRDEILHKKKFVDLMELESKNVFCQNFPLFKKQGWIKNLEFQMLHKNGSMIWVNLNSTAIYDEAGNFLMSRSSLFDITDRKQTEKLLQQSELTLKSFFNSAIAPMGIVELHDRDILHIADNWAAAQFFHNTIAGMQNQFSSNLGASPATIERWISYYQEAQRTQAPVRFEYLHSSNDGESWLSGTVCPIAISPSRYSRFSYIVEDITERKLAEKILQQYERIISNTTDGIATINRHYIYQIANQSYLTWCNKSESEVVGNSLRNIVGADLFDRFIQPRLDRCLAGEIIQYEKWFDYPNLVPQFLSVTYTPLRDIRDHIVGVIVSLRDLTRLKKAEQMLDLQAVITRNMAEGICLVRGDNGVIVYANPKFEQMFGYDADELNGQHVSIVNYGSEPITAEEVNQSIRTAVLQNGEFSYEVHNVKKDGTPFWCSATTSVFKHSDYGDLLVAVHQDITERQKIEKIKDEFIGIVSHELRTPLTAIQMSLGLIQTGVYDQKPEKIRRMLEIALLDTNRLVNLVNDILDLERLDSGQKNLEKTICKATDLIQQAIDGIQAIATKQLITVTFTPTDIEVLAAGDAIVQTLTNLLSNAIKFSPNESTIYLSVEHQIDCVMFQIYDRGRGIPADKLELIFGRFQQVDASDSREKGGTGLGLAICQTIIEKHGGKIWAESVLGEGSNFFFTLPLG